MACMLQDVRLQATGLCEMVGDEGLVPTEGNHVNINSSSMLTDMGLHPCFMTMCRVVW